MITVNRVYVDPEGYIEDGHGHRFEDQEQIKKLMHDIYPIINPDLFYTIEPIQVELVYKQWCDKSTGECHRCEYIQGTHGAQDCKHPTIIVARIVTEEEKPAAPKLGAYSRYLSDTEIIQIFEKPADYETPLHSLVNGLMQPAPVVDKPGALKLDPEYKLDAYRDGKFEFSFSFTKTIPDEDQDKRAREYIEAINNNYQQPTEWIPVSTQPENKTRHIVMGRMEGTSERCLYIAKIYRADTWNAQAWMVAGKHIHDVTHYLPLSSLPEPPKP